MRAMKIPSIFTAIDKFTAPVRKMGEAVSKFANKSEAELARMERAWRKTGDTAFKVGRQGLFLSAALIAPLVMVTKQAIDFEDKMADVGKTTGMSGIVLEKFGEAILETSTKTRTSINDLVKIGEIGGQLGVAENELLSFVDSANKFNVALGSDFSGGVEEAISSVGKIKALFGETRGLDISEVIRRSGSAINELSAVGSGTSANITDFTLRLGALPDALKPSVQNTMALATALEEMGINSEVGARGIGDVITTAGVNLPAFAEQMNLTADAARNLLNTDSTEFMKKFAASFKGMSTEDLSTTLKALKIGDTGTIKVIGALASGTERLTELQIVANEAFEKGTSLQTEYDKKNSTAAAKWAILKNNIQVAAITLGQAFLPVVLDLMKSITPMIQKFSKWVRENKGLVGGILKAVAVVATFSAGISVLSYSFGGVAKSIAFGAKIMAYFKSATGLAMIAQLKLNLAMLASPWGIAIAAAAALAIGLYALSKAFNTVSASERVNAEIQDRVLDQTLDQRVEIAMLTNTLRTHRQESAAYQSALEKLEEIQPGIIEKFNLQEKSLKAITAAEKELTANILKRAETEVMAEMLKEKIKEKMTLQEEGPGFWDKAWSFTKRSTLAVSTLGISEATGLQGDILNNATEANNEKIRSLTDEISVLTSKIGTQMQEPVSDLEAPEVFSLGQVARDYKQNIEITVKGDGTFGIKQSGDSIGTVKTGSMSVPGMSTTR